MLAYSLQKSELFSTRPAGPSLMRRVCGFGFGNRRSRAWQARLARCLQIAQAHAALALALCFQRGPMSRQPHAHTAARIRKSSPSTTFAPTTAKYFLRLRRSVVIPRLRPFSRGLRAWRMLRSAPRSAQGGERSPAASLGREVRPCPMLRRRKAALEPILLDTA